MPLYKMETHEQYILKELLRGGFPLFWIFIIAHK